MTIGQLVLTLDHGGQEHLIIRLCVALQRIGIRSPIVVLGDGALVDEARRRGIETVVLAKRDGLDPLVVPSLWRLVRRQRLDVLHTHNMAPLIYGTIAARLAGIPTINTRHGRAPLTAPRAIWHLTQRVVAVSDDARTELLRHNRIDARKVGVIVNGIEVGVYAPRPDRRAAVRRELGIAEDAPVVGTIGRLSPEKDQATLLRAMQRLLVQIPGARLVIAGGGSLESDLRAQAATLGISSQTRFLGFRHDVQDVIHAFDVFALPSLMEGVSLTLLEAMAANLPVVTTAVGGNPEVVVQDETGCLIEPGNHVALADALSGLLRDRPRARALGAGGRRRAEAVFSLDTMVGAYVDLYRELLGRPID